ncbi:hypothetical protein [Frateuria sp. YIM B11624]|uniref:hypothetical protein n=1 Tax=Frateuria sp. YIM B11624 TaxID=3143185 RepID=UPI003C72C712
MNALKGIQEAIALRLQRSSAAVQDQLKLAGKCVTFLHVHGCTVQQVTVRPDYVVVDINQPSDWLQGSIKIRRVNGFHRETVMVAKVLDCQVQWVVREKHRLLQREG